MNLELKFIFIQISVCCYTIRMIQLKNPEWRRALAHEFTLPYWHKLNQEIDRSYTNGICFPPANQIWTAFELCPPKKLSVVIIGQDPYHQTGQAHGLAFSVPDKIPIPPSLRNIYQEIKNDCLIVPPPSGNLSRWSKQGVLLLNTTLTVEQNCAHSHKNYGWEKFTDAVINTISTEHEHLVFLLWGNAAIKMQALIDVNKHLILTAPHPSPPFCLSWVFWLQTF